MKFGEYLRQKRENRQMSFNQVAMYAGVSSGYLSMLERGVVGQRGPSPVFLRKLANPLRVPYEVLLEAAGYYIFPLEPGVDEKDLIPMLCEVMGCTEEVFAERFGFRAEEMAFMKRHGATPDTLLMIAMQLVQYYAGLTPVQNALLREAGWVMRKDSKDARKLEGLLQVMLG